MKTKDENGFGLVEVIIVLVVVIAIGLAAYFVAAHKTKSSTSKSSVATTSTSQTSSTAAVKTYAQCQFLPQSDAANILGVGSVQLNKSQSGTSKTADFTEYDCTYSTTDAAGNSLAITVSVAEYYQKSTVNLAYNAAKQYSTGAVSVSGVGDNAFWFPTSTTLDVLKGNDYIKIIAGKIASTDDSLAIQTGKIVVQNL
jgi:hypothetical protein